MVSGAVTEAGGRHWVCGGSSLPVMSSSTGSSCSSSESDWGASHRKGAQPTSYGSTLPVMSSILWEEEESSLINWELFNPSPSISILWEPPYMSSHLGVPSSTTLPFWPVATRGFQWGPKQPQNTINTLNRENLSVRHSHCHHYHCDPDLGINGQLGNFRHHDGIAR